MRNRFELVIAATVSRGFSQWKSVSWPWLLRLFASLHCQPSPTAKFLVRHRRLSGAGSEGKHRHNRTNQRYLGPSRGSPLFVQNTPPSGDTQWRRAGSLIAGPLKKICRLGGTNIGAEERKITKGLSPSQAVSCLIFSRLK